MIKSDKYDRRLKILTPSEKYCIYEKPQFTLGERRTHFRLSRYENDIIFKKLKSNNSRLYFILQLGYFRFSLRFFKFKFSDSVDDIEYISKKYFSHCQVEELIKECDKKTPISHYPIMG